VAALRPVLREIGSACGLSLERYRPDTSRDLIEVKTTSSNSSANCSPHQRKGARLGGGPSCATARQQRRGRRRVLALMAGEPDGALTPFSEGPQHQRCCDPCRAELRCCGPTGREAGWPIDDFDSHPHHVSGVRVAEDVDASELRTQPAGKIALSSKRMRVRLAAFASVFVLVAAWAGQGPPPSAPSPGPATASSAAAELSGPSSTPRGPPHLRLRPLTNPRLRRTRALQSSLRFVLVRRRIPGLSPNRTVGTTVMLWLPANSTSEA
jgi:hypothetical protein